MSKLEIEIGDTVRISDKSEYYGCGDTNPMCEGVVERIQHTVVVAWDNGHNNTYQLHDLTLIKKGKTMQFTKSDLKTGMFVKQRNGDFKIVLGDAICGYDYFSPLYSYNVSMLLCDSAQTEFDIMAVYNKNSNVALSYYLQGQDLQIIWKRTEQTEAQKEMEVLQEQAKALQEQITKLQSKL